MARRDRVGASGRGIQHSDRYIRDSPAVGLDGRPKKGSIVYEQLKQTIRRDLAYARTVAEVVEGSKDIWDRASAISESGEFPAGKIDGLIKEEQLDSVVRQKLDSIPTVTELSGDFQVNIPANGTDDFSVTHSPLGPLAGAPYIEGYTGNSSVLIGGNSADIAIHNITQTGFEVSITDTSGNGISGTVEWVRWGIL